MPKKPVRRVNDAQVERLLSAMKRDPHYRSQLAKRLVEREGHTPGTPDFKRRYSSTMRRFQRYVTESSEKRSFARAPVEYQRETRREAREIAVQAPEFVKRREERQQEQQQIFDRDRERVRDTRERDYSFDTYREVTGNEIRAIIAYHDGDLEQVRESLNLTARSERLLELAFNGVDVSNARGSSELMERAADWLDGLFSEDQEDIQDFHDWLMDAPDWMAQIVFDDMAKGKTSFADWIDAWRDDGMNFDATKSEFWKLWREAYARSKSK